MQGQFLAAGSRSGVVNVYDVSTPLDGKQPKPAATVDNLVTPVGSVRFNHDAQVSLAPSCRRLFSIVAHILAFLCRLVSAVLEFLSPPFGSVCSRPLSERSLPAVWKLL